MTPQDQIGEWTGEVTCRRTDGDGRDVGKGLQRETGISVRREGLSSGLYDLLIEKDPRRDLVTDYPHPIFMGSRDQVIRPIETPRTRWVRGSTGVVMTRGQR